MNCPKCKSPNVRIDYVQTEGRSNHRGNGLGGHANNAARTMTAITTLGMSNLVWRKSKGGSKTKFKNERMGICQDCGAGFKVK